MTTDQPPTDTKPTERPVRRAKDGVKPTDARPCPFCGETPAVVRESELNWIGGKYDSFIIKCKRFKCMVKPSVTRRTLREVMEAWNMRNPFA